jgi:DNA gyrase subunit A
LEVIRRRSEFELKRNEARLHILEALRIAIKNIDLVIQLIRKAKTTDDARQNLMKRLNLDEIQANAILDMPLKRLASLERQKIEEEYKQVSEAIKNLKALLKSAQKMRQVVIDELTELKSKYADARRTRIIQLKEGEKASQLFTQTDVMPLENFWVEINAEGFISRTEGDKPNRLGGENAPWSILRTNSHQTLFLATPEGQAAAIHMLSIPIQRGEEPTTPVHKLSPLSEDEVVQAAFAIPIEKNDIGERYVLTITRQGMIKKSLVTELPGASANRFTLVKVNEGDELFRVLLTDGKQEVLLTTAKGMSIRFSETDVRPMGLLAAGVNGIKLKEGDYVVGASLIEPGNEVGLVTNQGWAKRIKAEEFPQQGRYGQGVISWKLKGEDSIVVQLCGKLTDHGVCHFRKSASKVFTLTNAVERTRQANGQILFKLKPDDELIGFTCLDDFSSYWEKA